MSVTVEIDGMSHAVPEGRNLLAACLERGHDLPFFCWHGALGAVGACRLCAVRLHAGPDDAEGRIDMACMCGAAEGQRVAIADPEARAFRARVTEWLMLNHPHDCPTCEEGGACHLQDMVLMTGHRTRRTRFPKRTHRNQWLGPLLTHEMNRCIGCYRCTRFYRQYAGGRDLDVFGAHDAVWFGRAEDGPLESPFAANLAEVCPTGVFNDRAWSGDYARKWDMTATPSVCTGCAVGCNTFLAARDGRVRRVQNRYHGALNGYFLCDRGRFAPLAQGAASRLAAPRIAGRAVADSEAGAAAARALPEGAVGIGSPRASLEANAALRRLVGPERFFSAVSDREAELVAGLAGLLRRTAAASLADLEAADAVLVLGEDLTGTAPRMALALRQTARNAERALAAEKGVPDWQDTAVRVAGEGRRTPVHLVAPTGDATLDDAATLHLREPDGVARFGEEVAAALAGEAAADAPARVAKALAGARRPVVVAGVRLQSPEVLDAAARIAGALGPGARVAPVPPEANSLGLALMGAGGLESAATLLETGPARTAVVLEADLAERAAPGTVRRVRDAAGTLVVLDHLATPTAEVAGIALPVASPEEAEGTFVNHEGRAQTSHAAVPDAPPPAWQRLAALAGEPSDPTLAELLERIAAEIPALAGLPGAAPPEVAGHIPRAPAVLPGRTADDRAGQDPAATPPRDPHSPLGWTIERTATEPTPAALLTGYTLTGWTSSNGLHRFQEEIGGPLRGGDPGTRLIVPESGPPPALRAASSCGRGLARVTLADPFRGHEAARTSPPLAARMPTPRVWLHPEDAAALGLSDDAALRIDGVVVAARLSVTDAIAPGSVGLPEGPETPRGAGRSVRVEAA